MAESFEDIAVGDEIVVSSNHRRAVHVVERVTPKQFQVASCGRFWRSNGRQVGGDTWSFLRVERATDELKEEIAATFRRNGHLARIKHRTRFQDLSNDQLERIVKILDEPHGKAIHEPQL